MTSPLVKLVYTCLQKAVSSAQFAGSLVATQPPSDIFFSYPFLPHCPLCQEGTKGIGKALDESTCGQVGPGLEAAVWGFWKTQQTPSEQTGFLMTFTPFPSPSGCSDFT